jgi:hypothetical protein
MCMFSCEVSFLICDFIQNLHVLTNFSKIRHYLILLKSIQWFRGCAGTDGQTHANMAKRIVGFLQLIVM